MRHVLIAAALVTAAACSDDTAIDPAWVTPGTAGECNSGGGSLPTSIAGSYAAPWACRGGGVDGTLPCDPDANPFLADSEIALTAAGNGYTLAVADRQIALTMPNDEVLSAEPFTAGDYRIFMGIATCAGGSIAMMLSASPAGADDLNRHYGWAATLTRL